MGPPAATPEEQTLIKQLRTQLQDLELEEEELSSKQLIRWIRARDHNLENAEAMFRSSVAWRQEIDAKGLLSWQPSEWIINEFPFTICGLGCDPVILFQAGKMDFRTHFENGCLEEGLKYIYKSLEQVLFLLKKFSVEHNYLKQVIVIIDLEGLQLRQMTNVNLIAEFIKGLRAYEANYPETLKAAFIVNAPSIFSILYRIITKVLSTRTFSKIQVHNHNVGKYKEELLKIMNPKEFPEKYGGAGLLSTNLIPEYFDNINGN